MWKSMSWKWIAGLLLSTAAIAGCLPADGEAGACGSNTNVGADGSCLCVAGFDWCSDEGTDCCAVEGGQEVPTGEADVQVEAFNVLTDGDGSFLTFLAHMMGADLGDDTLPFATVTLSSEGGIEDLILEVEMPGYSEVYRQTISVEAGAPTTIALRPPAFDFERLYAVTSAVAASAEVRLLVDGDLVDVGTQSFQIQPLNRFKFFLSAEDGKLDMRPFIATFVTPEDREHKIQELLTEAAAFSQSGAIIGYQAGTADSAYDQARAVYNALQARGMVYTSVAGSFFDSAQYVKLPAQSLDTGSSNCIDGTLVFASAFEAMGMEPHIVYVRGHAFVGVRQAPGSDEWWAIETTMVSSATFDEAVGAGAARHQQAVTEGDTLVLMVDLKQLRVRGVRPVNL
jgi:hypothetical protein